MNTTLRKIGNSSGVILPKDVLERLNLSNGDELAIIETEDGLKLVKADDDFSRQMDHARRFMAKYHKALSKLAK